MPRTSRSPATAATRHRTADATRARAEASARAEARRRPRPPRPASRGRRRGGRGGRGRGRGRAGGPPLTPTPELRDQLRLLLGDTRQPYRFSDAQIDVFLELSASLEQAAAAGWTATATLWMRPDAIVQARYGTESFTFASPRDLYEFALNMAQRFKGGRAYVLSMARPCLPGVASSGCGCRACEGLERCLVAVCGDWSRSNCQCWPSPCR